jgi:hypothetical protein
LTDQSCSGSSETVINKLDGFNAITLTVGDELSGEIARSSPVRPA